MGRTPDGSMLDCLVDSDTVSVLGIELKCRVPDGATPVRGVILGAALPCNGKIFWIASRSDDAWLLRRCFSGNGCQATVPCTVRVRSSTVFLLSPRSLVSSGHDAKRIMPSDL